MGVAIKAMLKRNSSARHKKDTVVVRPGLEKARSLLQMTAMLTARAWTTPTGSREGKAEELSHSRKTDENLQTEKKTEGDSVKDDFGFPRSGGQRPWQVTWEADETSQ